MLTSLCDTGLEPSPNCHLRPLSTYPSRFPKRQLAITGSRNTRLIQGSNAITICEGGKSEHSGLKVYELDLHRDKSL